MRREYSTTNGTNGHLLSNPLLDSDPVLNSHSYSNPVAESKGNGTWEIPIPLKLFKFIILLCALAAISRNFAGGYEFIERIFPERTPREVTIACGSFIGAAASYSPFHQLSIAIDKVINLFKKPTKAQLLALTIIFGVFTFWSGLSFAEMGSDSFDKMLSTDWGLGENKFVGGGVDTVFGMTLASQSLLYTEKLFNLKLTTIWKAVKRSPLKMLLLALNIIAAGVGVWSNASFGEQAASEYMQEPYSMGLGIISAVGPCALSVTGMNAVASLAVEAYQGASAPHAINEEQVLNQQTHHGFSLSVIGWKVVLIAFCAALVSAIPNLEYSLQTTPDNGWAYVIIFFSFIYNAIPKAAATMEKKFNERSQDFKLSDSKVSLLSPPIEHQPLNTTGIEEEYLSTTPA